MNLRDYLHVKRMKCTEFAKLVNYDKNYIQDIAAERKVPGKKFAKIVEIATQGEVPAESFFQKQIDDIERIA